MNFGYLYNIYTIFRDTEIYQAFTSARVRVFLCSLGQHLLKVLKFLHKEALLSHRSSVWHAGSGTVHHEY